MLSANRLSAPAATPSLQSPAPRPALDLPPYNPDQHVPPPPPMPTLTVTPKGVLHLHSSLRERLGLHECQPIDLVPPVWKSLFWHLDLRKCAPRQIYWHAKKLRADGISLPPGLVTENLLFYLLPGEPGHAGYYPLLAANTLDPAFYAHLAQ
ncbi:hypothetical protein [Hymenobacter negativus]|uniref:Uncharacterized protein n=1 Tax=Hymenobacter negativus TaxID=2795026 RepID=A0ABS0Q8G6_9BACT|nr:hypothetical protein [Hymenobacter negativus]MBH8558982.1 hypothetical protein [Hymenobacter negativus]